MRAKGGRIRQSTQRFSALRVLAGVGDRLLGDAQQLGLDLGAEPGGCLVEGEVHGEARAGPDRADVVRQRGAEAGGRGDLAAQVEDRQPELADDPAHLRAHVLQLGRAARRWSRWPPARRVRSRARRPPAPRRRGSPAPAAAAPPAVARERTSSKTRAVSSRRACSSSSRSSASRSVSCGASGASVMTTPIIRVPEPQREHGAPSGLRAAVRLRTVGRTHLRPAPLDQVPGRQDRLLGVVAVVARAARARLPRSGRTPPTGRRRAARAPRSAPGRPARPGRGPRTAGGPPCAAGRAAVAPPRTTPRRRACRCPAADEPGADQSGAQAGQRPRCCHLEAGSRALGPAAQGEDERQSRRPRSRRPVPRRRAAPVTPARTTGTIRYGSASSPPGSVMLIASAAKNALAEEDPALVEDGEPGDRRPRRTPRR